MSNDAYLDLDLEPDFDDLDEDEEASPEEIKALIDSIESRCKLASIAFERIDSEEDIFDPWVKISLPAGREHRTSTHMDSDDFKTLLGIQFEKYTFISGYEAICNFEEGTIESFLRIIQPTPHPLGRRRAFARLFNMEPSSISKNWDQLEITLTSAEDNQRTTVKISPATTEISCLANGRISSQLSIKIQRDGIKRHDDALDLLRSLSDAIFLQIDMLIGLPLELVRSRTRTIRRRPRNSDSEVILSYPKYEFDPTPTSLYWYAKSATGMPLLQFLAFYQVIEFYYPIYSQSEAKRRLSAILKDPTFRGDRDSDLGRVLSAIQYHRNGAIGDERSQLKATLNECIDPTSLRQFIEQDEDRKKFLASKAKGLSEHKIPIANEDADLRPDVAERIYEIRCKIVHTKSDTKNPQAELLLPFSKEAEQLNFDIELAEYLAQQVLVAASTTSRKS